MYVIIKRETLHAGQTRRIVALSNQRRDCPSWKLGKNVETKQTGWALVAVDAVVKPLGGVRISCGGRFISGSIIFQLTLR
jgi:hypothetical protein